ncbi:MAG: phosphonate C-P lyase system protein PhnL [Desulfobacteraceae bacterium]|nr:MAG: phosphonate C-P lyase system protein PhnL [Desulfobacteraceae bacterium]
MITVDNLSKSFTLHILNGKKIEACRGISFNVPQGGFLGLSGHSGAGKSTVLKCIYRTYLSSSGAIHYNSAAYGMVDLATLHDRALIEIREREMGYVSQFLKVIPRVSAVDIIMEPILARNGVSRKEARNRTIELLERLRIPAHLFDAYPATFSGGEQQRVNIARAVSWKPRLLLLDEPTASLDKDSVGVVLEILKELRMEGTTMIGIFHDTDLLESVTDLVYHIC